MKNNIACSINLFIYLMLSIYVHKKMSSPVDVFISTRRMNFFYLFLKLFKPLYLGGNLYK